MRRRPNRPMIALAIPAALLLAWSSVTSPLRPLSAAELGGSIGASTNVSKCTASCNKANSYNAPCLNVRDGSSCNSCSMGATSTDYADGKDAAGCDASSPGWNLPVNGATANCGVVQNGTCSEQTCTNLINQARGCSQPTNLAKQTTPGGNP